MFDDDEPRVDFAGVSVANVSQHLFSSASMAASEVLRHYTTQTPFEELTIAIHVGNAAEWLIRSALAAKNPALLADPRSTPSLIALANIPTVREVSATELRTISTLDVVQKLVHIHPGLRILDLVKDISAVRNAAAHMALVEHRALEHAATDLAALVSELLPIFGRSAEEFWGHKLRGVAARLLEERDGDRQVHVSNKIMASRASWEARVRGLDLEITNSIRATLEQQRPRFVAADQTDIRFMCPACGSQAWVSYDRFTDVVAARVPDVVDPAHPRHMEVPVIVTVKELWCPVCDLTLEGSSDMTQIPNFFPADRVEYESIDMSDFWP